MRDGGEKARDGYADNARTRAIITKNERATIGGVKLHHRRDCQSLTSITKTFDEQIDHIQAVRWDTIHLLGQSWFCVRGSNGTRS